MARQDDGRWTMRILSLGVDGYRHVGRPRKIWEDDILKFFMDNFGDDDWINVAPCRDTWKHVEYEFLDWSR